MFDKIKKALKSEDKLREEKCVRVAKKIVELVGDYDNKLIEKDTSKMNKHYKDLVQSIKEVMLEEDINLNDVNFIFQLALVPLDNAKRIVNDNLNHLLGKAQDEFWGKDHSDITIKDLDTKL